MRMLFSAYCFPIHLQVLFFYEHKHNFLIMEFFEGMEPLLKAYWFIALPASAIFVVQTIMTFMGGDASDGLDADFDGDLGHADGPFQLFSLRNLINFLLGFSWSGVSFYDTIESKMLLIVVSAVVGILFVVVFFLIIMQVRKLGEDNSFAITDALHKTGSVYLTIPAERGGTGKVQVSVKGAVHELDAITLGDRLNTGSLIRIIEIENNHLVLVEKL